MLTLIRLGCTVLWVSPVVARCFLYSPSTQSPPRREHLELTSFFSNIPGLCSVRLIQIVALISEWRSLLHCGLSADSLKQFVRWFTPARRQSYQGDTYGSVDGLCG